MLEKRGEEVNIQKARSLRVFAIYLVTQNKMATTSPPRRSSCLLFVIGKRKRSQSGDKKAKQCDSITFRALRQSRCCNSESAWHTRSRLLYLVWNTMSFFSSTLISFMAIQTKQAKGETGLRSLARRGKMASCKVRRKSWFEL